jgi:hypothetical protein
MTGGTAELCIHHHAGASKGRTATVSDAHATFIRARKIDAFAVRAKPVREGAPQQANGNHDDHQGHNADYSHWIPVSH